MIRDVLSEPEPTVPVDDLECPSGQPTEEEEARQSRADQSEGIEEGFDQWCNQ